MFRFFPPTKENKLDGQRNPSFTFSCTTDTVVNVHDVTCLNILYPNLTLVSKFTCTVRGFREVMCGCVCGCVCVFVYSHSVSASDSYGTTCRMYIVGPSPPWVLSLVTTRFKTHTLTSICQIFFPKGSKRVRAVTKKRKVSTCTVSIEHVEDSINMHSIVRRFSNNNSLRLLEFGE